MALNFALSQLGAVYVPLNPRWRPPEVVQALSVVQPVLLVSDDAHDGQVTLSQLAGEGRKLPMPAVPPPRETDTHVMFFTSGTTGAPKAAELSHRVDRLRAAQAYPDWPSGPHVCMFPQFHMAGWLSPQAAWLRGDEVVYVNGHDTEGILAAIERFGGRSFYGLPAVLRRVLDIGPGRFDLSSLQALYTGTSATPADLLDAVDEAFGRTLAGVVYGSTEAGVSTFLRRKDLGRKPGSVGLPVPPMTARVDADGQLWLRGPTLFSGYFGNPEATGRVLANGWLRTGELAASDDDGYLQIIGRDGDLIRTGGEWVAPAEVETVLRSHQSVVDVAVVGVPSSQWGEVVVACVIPRPGELAEVGELRRHCDDHLTRYKQPRHVVIVEEIPRTAATMQTDRAALRRQAMGRLGRA